MRKQFVSTVSDILKSDKKLVLLLGDIGVFGFKEAFAKFPDRVYNIGILEQSTIGLASGLAMKGLIPVVHTIAPFIVERSLEQIKDDFGYQKLGGNFVSLGASYDYTSLGCTHHCPGDVGILKNVPEIEIILPGSAQEFDRLFRQAYNDGHPTYFRLSEKHNSTSQKVIFGQAKVIEKGKSATVIAVGPMLDNVVEAAAGLDITILYYTTLTPFDDKTLFKNFTGDKVIVCEPYYSGALDYDISEAMKSRKISISHIGVPREFLRNYGSTEDQDKFMKLTVNDIRAKLKTLIK